MAASAMMAFGRALGELQKEVQEFQIPEQGTITFP